MLEMFGLMRKGRNLMTVGGVPAHVCQCQQEWSVYSKCEHPLCQPEMQL